jgi:hypothetical protein
VQVQRVLGCQGHVGPGPAVELHHRAAAGQQARQRLQLAQLAAGLAQFDFAIDPHLAVTDDHLGFAAAGDQVVAGPGGQAEQGRGLAALGAAHEGEVGGRVREPRLGRLQRHVRRVATRIATLVCQHLLLPPLLHLLLRPTLSLPFPLPARARARSQNLDSISLLIVGFALHLLRQTRESGQPKRDWL